MINASHDKEFVFHDGSRARNLLELVSKIESMSDHEFHHFVNPHKNDFANWTEHVLGDKSFAEDLRTLLSKNETISIIKDKIAEASFGNSIIKIPKSIHENLHHEEHVIADLHSRTNSEKSSEYKTEHHAAVPIEAPVERVAEHKVEHHNEVHNVPIKHYPNHNVVHHKQVDDDNFISNTKDKKHEQLKKFESRNNWFHLFSKKDLSKPNMIKLSREESHKLYSEEELREELEQDSRENALWVILYFALVLLIITLLVYKLFL